MGLFGFIAFGISTLILITIFREVFGLGGAIGSGLGVLIGYAIGFGVTKFTKEKSWSQSTKSRSY